MKKKVIAKVAAFIMTLCMMVCVFTSCSNTLNGTYKSDGVVSQTLTFEDDKVTMSAFGINAEGTYKIEKDKIIITYTLFGLSYDFEKSFEKDGKSIYIDGTEFVKQ